MGADFMAVNAPRRDGGAVPPAIVVTLPPVAQNARWLAHLGDKAYAFAIRITRLVNMLRRWFGVPY